MISKQNVTTDAKDNVIIIYKCGLEVRKYAVIITKSNNFDLRYDKREFRERAKAFYYRAI